MTVFLCKLYYCKLDSHKKVEMNRQNSSSLISDHEGSPKTGTMNNRSATAGDADDSIRKIILTNHGIQNGAEWDPLWTIQESQTGPYWRHSL